MQQPLTEIINNAICDSPEILLASLGLEEEIHNDRINCECFVHGGDNKHGMSIYFNDYHDVRGRWKCHTNNCQVVFLNTLVGMVRGILSNRHCGWSKPGDKIYNWQSTLDYLKNLYNVDGDLKVDQTTVERNKFIRNCKCITDSYSDSYICSREKYLRTLTSSSTYLLGRGFSEGILNEYEVRHYTGYTKLYISRSIIPIFDEKNRHLRGFTARSERNQEPKWVYSTGFSTSTNLFNYTFASKYIRKSRRCIIVEGPLDVFRLREAGINDCVAIFGANAWNDYKRYLLDKLGVMKLVVVLDNDEAGLAGREKIRKEAGRFYNIMDIVLPDSVNDVADMSIEQVKELFRKVA